MNPTLAMTARSRNTLRGSGTRRHPTQHRGDPPYPRAGNRPKNTNPKPIKEGRTSHERSRLTMKKGPVQ